jgi:hypothetical protein
MFYFNFSSGPLSRDMFFFSFLPFHRLKRRALASFNGFLGAILATLDARYFYLWLLPVVVLLAFYWLAVVQDEHNCWSACVRPLPLVLLAFYWLAVVQDEHNCWSACVRPLPLYCLPSSGRDSLTPSGHFGTK